MIYIVRDPRDVLISFYNYQITMRRLSEEYPLSDYATRILDGSVPFGSWDSHVAGWLAARESRDGFFLVRYEDL